MLIMSAEARDMSLSLLGERERGRWWVAAEVVVIMDSKKVEHQTEDDLSLSKTAIVHKSYFIINDSYPNKKAYSLQDTLYSMHDTTNFNYLYSLIVRPIGNKTTNYT